MVGQARSPKVWRAVKALESGRLSQAEKLIRSHLDHEPTNVAALCILGDLAARAGIHKEAERIFRRVLFLAPLFADAQLKLASILALQDSVTESLALLDDVLNDWPERCDIALFRLNLLTQIGAYSAAKKGFDTLSALHPERPEIWVARGNLLNTLGDLAAGVAAYRRAIALDVDFADAWWGLANLKIYKFDADEVVALREAISRLADVDSNREALLRFALGKALSDAGNYSDSFDQYVLGNQICFTTCGDTGTSTSREVDRSIKFFTVKRFQNCARWGHPSVEPIFIVGLPRSGSTLIEQILASHPQVEGTSELPYIPMLIHRLIAERWSDSDVRFPDLLAELPVERLRELGDSYLQSAAKHRLGGRELFIDKLPNNWRYVGLIHMIFPNARLVNTWRSPMACLWSSYCQRFAQGNEFSYSFESLARTWYDHLRLAKYFNQTLPGVVRHISHENLLRNPEAGVRALLAGLDLPFAASCVEFHRNDRPVRTASAQQVRRPLEPRWLDEWRHFEPYLDALKQQMRDWRGGDLGTESRTLLP